MSTDRQDEIPLSLTIEPETETSIRNSVVTPYVRVELGADEPEEGPIDVRLFVHGPTSAAMAVKFASAVIGILGSVDPHSLNLVNLDEPEPEV